MAITCPNQMVLYMIPMMLGRTFNVQTNMAGLDIFNPKDVADAQNTKYRTDEVESDFKMITEMSEKRDLLGISGELSLKISSGLVDIKGAGEYLRDTSNSNNSVEVVIRLRYKTMLQKIEDSIQPNKPYKNTWKRYPQELVGTHVVTSVLFGGEVFASVKFIAHKENDTEKIKGAVNVAFNKGDVFNISASGELEKLAQTVSSMARIDITYFANVPIKSLPSTLKGLQELVGNFSKQVKEFNNGEGVAICVELTPLSEYVRKDPKFKFEENQELKLAFSDFNHKFDNLREAKALLNEFVATLPETYPMENMRELIEFSKNLNGVLKKFYDAIGKLDLTVGTAQLSEAIQSFKTALGEEDFDDNNRYTAKMKKLKEKLAPKEDTTSPRGVYVRWGKGECDLRKGRMVQTGVIASFPERGVGSGTKYQCIPDDMDRKLLTTKGVQSRESTLSAVRYKDLSMFADKGRDLENQVALCSVCETLMHPTVRMFPVMDKCPGDWTEEYKGFLVSTYKSSGKTEFICLDIDAKGRPPKQAAAGEFQSYILPTVVGGSHGLPPTWTRDQSVPCAVCSK